jgi:hypothetical protein
MSILFLGNYTYDSFDKEDTDNFFVDAEKYRIIQLTSNRPVIDNTVADAKIEKIINE